MRMDRSGGRWRRWSCGIRRGVAGGRPRGRVWRGMRGIGGGRGRGFCWCRRGGEEGLRGGFGRRGGLRGDDGLGFLGRKCETLEGLEWPFKAENETANGLWLPDR